MSISFFAYHGNADLRRAVIDDFARHISNGHLANDAHSAATTLCLISAIAGGEYDISAAHQKCGFPVPLLLGAEAIFEGLAPEDAQHFGLALVKAAAVDTDLADVAWVFVEWMFIEAVATLGPSRVRTAAKEAGPIFRKLADEGALSPAEQRKAKAQAKKMRRRGLDGSSDEQKLVAKAVGTMLDSGSEHIGIAIHWIAQLAEAPSDQYRRYARKMPELVEAA
jgi:hypothetical protein